MSTVLDNLASLMAADYANPCIHRAWFDRVAAGTAASATSGYISAMRFPSPFVVPTVGGSINGLYCTRLDLYGTTVNTVVVAGIEVLLGSLAVATGTFTAGSSMPTRVVYGDSLQTNSMLPMLVVTAALTATTPLITVTYANQAGTGGQSAQLTLGTNAAVNSAFCIMPHLASGDCAVQSVSNITKSAGSAGTLKVYGVIPLAWSVIGGAGSFSGVDPLANPWPMVRAAAGDVISVYQFGATTAADTLPFITLTPETN